MEGRDLEQVVGEYTEGIGAGGGRRLNNKVGAGSEGVDGGEGGGVAEGGGEGGELKQEHMIRTFIMNSPEAGEIL